MEEQNWNVEVSYTWTGTAKNKVIQTSILGFETSN